MRQDRIACDTCGTTVKADAADGWIMVNLRALLVEDAATGALAVNRINATDFCSLEHLEKKAAELLKGSKPARKSTGKPAARKKSAARRKP